MGVSRTTWFREYPEQRLLPFLVSHANLELTLTELASGAGVSRQSVESLVRWFLRVKMVSCQVVIRSFPTGEHKVRAYKLTSKGLATYGPEVQASKSPEIL